MELVIKTVKLNAAHFDAKPNGDGKSEKDEEVGEEGDENPHASVVLDMKRNNSIKNFKV